MPDNLRPDKFRILALDAENQRPVGINFAKPAFVNIRLDEPVQIWEFREVGPNTYSFGLGRYRYTGVVAERVTVSVYPKIDVDWIITYRPEYDAYTIGLARDPSLVWTIDQGYTYPLIELAKIRPDFKDQLFRLQPIDE